MPIEIRLGIPDLAKVRFTTDVVWETAASLNALAFPREHLVHTRLQRRMPAHPHFDLDHLTTLTSNRFWVPDILCPSPVPASSHEAPESRLMCLRETPTAVATRDLQALRQLQPQTAAARMQPRQYIEATAKAMLGYWRDVLEPLWDRVEAVVSADIAHHRARLASDGLAATLPTIQDELSLVGDIVRVDMPRNAQVAAAGHGIWLLPSVFRWPWLAIDLRDQMPVISYAARGAGRVWEEPNRSHLELADLIGRSRTSILELLDIERTTTSLAEALDLAPSTISWHLSVMVAAGLLEHRRDGRRVQYTRTMVGDLLLTGGSALAPTSQAPRPDVLTRRSAGATV